MGKVVEKKDATVEDRLAAFSNIYKNSYNRLKSDMDFFGPSVNMWANYSLSSIKKFHPELTNDEIIEMLKNEVKKLNLEPLNFHFNPND